MTSESLQRMSVALIEKIAASGRVILLANNPLLTPALIDSLNIQDSDIVVSFNKCRNLPSLRRRHVNVFIHRHNYRKGGYFGYPYKGMLRLFSWFNPRLYSVMLGGDESTLPRAGDFSFLPLRQAFPALEAYPYEGLPTRGGPSTGFYALAFFDYLKQLKGASFDIVLVGFSDEGGTFWDGHAWEFEREWIKTSAVMVVKP